MQKAAAWSILWSAFLLSALMSPAALSQPRMPGVHEGDWFRYDKVYFDWFSNDTQVTIPPDVAMLNDTDWMNMSVVRVSTSNITLHWVQHFKNGTSEELDDYVDIVSGASLYAELMIISADLAVNDSVYAYGEYSTWKINETIDRTYPGGARLTSHVNITGDSYSWQTYWDKVTGAMTEMSTLNINRVGEYYTTYSYSFVMDTSNAWIIPEFHTSVSILIFFGATTLCAVILKRRLFRA